MRWIDLNHVANFDHRFFPFGRPLVNTFCLREYPWLRGRNDYTASLASSLTIAILPRLESVRCQFVSQRYTLGM